MFSIMNPTVNLICYRCCVVMLIRDALHVGAQVMFLNYESTELN